MLLKDYLEWKNKKMPDNKPTMIPGQIMPYPSINAESKSKIDIISFGSDNLVFLRSEGPNGLFYNASVIKAIKDSYEKEMIEEKSQKEYWRGRSEDIETAYNLLKSSIEKADKRIDEYEEKMKILADALTRSKLVERGKSILISRLKNQLNVTPTKRMAKKRAS